MKKITLLVISLLWLNSCAKKTAETNMNTKQLRHVVLFKFKKEAPPAAIKKIEDAFIGLPATIKTIKSFNIFEKTYTDHNYKIPKNLEKKK